MDEIIKYNRTEDLYSDACQIIEEAQKVAYRSVNVVLVMRNWLIGKRISEEELKGADRAEYGAQLIERLSKVLTEKYGIGFTKRTLYKYQQFYKSFPQIVPTVSAQSEEGLIVPTMGRNY